MPRIDEMPEYRAKHGRTTHDLSHKFGFTASVAHLLPVFHDFLQAGETVDLSFKYNLRTQPLASAAMVDISSHVEYFFVPINLLYEPFGNYFYDINDNYSSMYPHVPMGLPLLDFDDMVDEALSDPTIVYGFDHCTAHQYRLMDMLGYNVVNYSNGSGGSGIWNPKVFPYPILAYNCIYQYYYRLDTRQTFDQASFNWDKFYSTSVVDHLVWDTKYFRLYYRPKASDYFTDIKVSPIVDVLNANVQTSLPVVNDWLSRGNNSVGNVLTSGGTGSSSAPWSGAPNNSNSPVPSMTIQTQFGFSAHSTFGSSVSPLNGADINTANIRAIFANEKLYSISGRARKHYDDQVLAHLGYKVPHDPKHEISVFGHDRGKIHIGEVISTADTANAGLGEIAGKGYGSLSADSHLFTAPCHGVVMAILSFEPDVTYGQTYLKSNALASSNDIPVPEFYYLGCQPLFGYEAMPDQVATRYDILGWQYRYEQWKRRYNRLTSAFTGLGSLDSWMLDFRPENGLLQTNAAATENYLGFLHTPSELNQIMLVNYSDNVGSYPEKVYDGDPFVVDGYVFCKKVSTMPDYSLPRLDA